MGGNQNNFQEEDGALLYSLEVIEIIFTSVSLKSVNGT